VSGFVVVAGLLTLLALIALLFPLLRRREGAPEAWRSAGVAGLLVLVGAAALYPVWSNYDWNAPKPAADSPQAMVGRLARRLEREPDDLDGWLMLGKSYAVIGGMDQQSPARWYELSVRAYERADTLAKGKSVEALMGLGDALLASGRSKLDGRAGRVYEQALELEGAPVLALLASAIAAFERNELPLAKERFEQLRQSKPPPQLEQRFEQFIADYLQQIEVQTAMASGAPGPAQAETPAIAVPLRVTIDPALASKATGTGRLFVLARRAGQQGGPPLAVRPPLEVKFPQDVELLSTDAMLGGHGFAAGDELEIEARVSLGGGANSRSGDPFGVIRVKAGERSRATLQIDQIKP
jgi:cytochrome c-type biogenesis protein CcmH